jgi:predicted ATPase
MLMQSVEASEEAAGLYRHAIETASHHGTPAFALRAALALPRLLDGKRRGEEVRPVLASVVAEFPDGSDLTLLAEARTLVGPSAY